jgi:putative flippase GtrA
VDVDTDVTTTADRTRTARVMDLARSPGGKKMIKYTLVSVISVTVYEIGLFILYGLVHWGARTANVVACSVATVPSYYLNRTWAWGKSGKSHFWKEVVPFWVLAFIGLAFSTWCADFAGSWADDHVRSHPVKTLVVMGAALGSFGVLWLGKFVFFNKVLFAHHPETMEDAPALDGRTGLPT